MKSAKPQWHKFSLWCNDIESYLGFPLDDERLDGVMTVHELADLFSHYYTAKEAARQIIRWMMDYEKRKKLGWT